MDPGGSITIEGLDEVLRGFDRAEKSVRDAAFRGLERGAMNIIADAKVNLRNNGSVVTGLLRASGKVQKPANTASMLDSSIPKTGRDMRLTSSTAGEQGRCRRRMSSNSGLTRNSR